MRQVWPRTSEETGKHPEQNHHRCLFTNEPGKKPSHGKVIKNDFVSPEVYTVTILSILLYSLQIFFLFACNV